MTNNIHRVKHAPFDRNTQPRRVRSEQRRHREEQEARAEVLDMHRGLRPLVRKSLERQLRWKAGNPSLDIVGMAEFNGRRISRVRDRDASRI